MRIIKVFVLFALAFFLLLTGCNSPAVASNIQVMRDFTSRYFQGGNRCAAYSGSGYYFTCGNFLYYADQDSMSPVVVCSRPDCLHDRETDPEKIALCNGYFDPYMKGNAAVFCSDGKLYVLSKVVNVIQDNYTDELNLFEVSDDGSSRREVIRISLPTGFQMTDTVVVYRDELIVGSTVYDEKLTSYIDISAYPLTGVQKKPRKLYHKEAQGYISSLICSMKYLYFIELNENGEYVHKILNTETLEAVCLEDNAAYAHFDVIDFALFSDGLIVAGYRDSTVCLMKAEPNGENPVEWIPAQSFPLKSLGLMASDDNYLYIQFMQTNAGDETRRMMMVIDNQGNVITTLDLYELIPNFQEIQITSGGFILLTGGSVSQNGHNQSACFWYMDKALLANGEDHPVRFLGNNNL